MPVCAWIDLILTILPELFTNLVVKLFGYGMCTSERRLDGVVVVITGSSAGIGKAAALLLAQKGAKVVMAVRDLIKAVGVMEEIKAKVPTADIEVVEVELASLDSVRECAETIKKLYGTIDILVNNAGVYLSHEKRTLDGHEIHLGVNYLSHFLLTLLLLPCLAKSDNPKVINVSSVCHRFSSLDINDLEMENSYSNMELYGKSKLAQILFTKELATRCPRIKTYSLHPGVVRTEIDRERALGFMTKNFLLKTSEEGAQTILHCILDEDADHQSGLYYMNCRVQSPWKEAMDTEKAKELWKRSLDMVELDEQDLECYQHL